MLGLGEGEDLIQHVQTRGESLTVVQGAEGGYDGGGVGQSVGEWSENQYIPSLNRVTRRWMSESSWTVRYSVLAASESG